MNVLLVVPWDQEFGGVASVVGNLARHLSRGGHQVLFLHPGDHDRLEQRTTAWGFQGYVLKLRTPFIREQPVMSVVAFIAFLVPTLCRLWRLTRLHRIQVVNIHYPTELFAPFSVLRWLLPIKLVVSVHGADLLPEGRRMERYSWWLQALLSSADAVVAPSRSFRDELVALFPRIAEKTLFIHNGVDIEELTRLGEAPGSGEGAGYLLCIAACNSKKAVDVLLRAFARISEATRCLRLVLVGDGPLRREHEELAHSLALDGRVQFLGWRARPEVARLLWDCDLFVLPSRSEPFGIVVAEALACRKAVVASSVGGIPEIIEDGVSGVLVKPDDPAALAQAVLALLEDRPRREALARAGYERALERFTCEATGTRYQQMYSTLVEGQIPVAASR
jgi:L-malate glycosyltransferase